MAERRLKAVPDEGEERLTIEQLAQRTGMTVRNIRNHQSRGLLPPPDVVARTGYYGPGHVERLHLIREMQAEGFNLNAIKRLLAGGEDSCCASAARGRPRPGARRPRSAGSRSWPRPSARSAGGRPPKPEHLKIPGPLAEGRYGAPTP